MVESTNKATQKGIVQEVKLQANFSGKRLSLVEYFIAKSGKEGIDLGPGNQSENL